MSKTIKQSEFTALVNKGFKKEQLAEYFDVPKSHIAGILKHWNLRIKSTRTAGYILEDNVEECVQETPTTNAIMEEQPGLEPDFIPDGISGVTEEQVPNDPYAELN